MDMTYPELFVRAIHMLAPFRSVALGLVCANAAIGLLSLAEPIVLGKMIDAFTNVVRRDDKDLFTIAPLFILWAGLGATTVAINFFTILHADKMSQRMRIHSIKEYTDRALHLPVSYHERHAPSHAFQILLDGSNTLWVLCFSFFRDNCASFVMLAMLCPILFFLNWRLAIPLVVLALCVYSLFSISLFYAEKAQVKADDKNTNFLARAADLLAHMKLIAVYDSASAEMGQFEKLQAQYLQEQEPLLTFWAGIITASRAASMLSILLVFGTGLWLMTNDLTTIGEVVGFSFIAQIAISRMDAVSVFLSTVFQQKPKLEKFFDVLEAEPFDGCSAVCGDKTEVQGDISFEDVSFSYSNGNVALRDVSFNLKAGTMTALVGRSGSGKTTILSLLCRFYNPAKGKILIDRGPLSDLPLRSLRRSMAVMFQDPMVLARSIEENVRFGSEGAPWNEVEDA
ncbi:MAG: glucan exporter ATP-binding family protein, partial [Spirosoma sp.]|nr:glucan exporter ATP-binding family protein [Spirosoma sp.]